VIFNKLPQDLYVVANELCHLFFPLWTLVWFCSQNQTPSIRMSFRPSFPFWSIHDGSKPICRISKRHYPCGIWRLLIQSVHVVHLREHGFSSLLASSIHLCKKREDTASPEDSNIIILFDYITHTTTTIYRFIVIAISRTDFLEPRDFLNVCVDKELMPHFGIHTTRILLRSFTPNIGCGNDLRQS
jgi:hypothetical protein